jgi:hypothetical protein
LACTVARAGPAEDEVGATRMLTEYVGTYASLDAHRVAANFDEPFTHVAGSGSQVLRTHDEAEAWLRPFFVRLKERGYGHSTCMPMAVKALDDGLVVATCRAVRFKSDGSELETVGATYLLRRTAQGWRIAVIASHPATTVLALP